MRVVRSVHRHPSCSTGHSEPSPPKLPSMCPEALLGMPGPDLAKGHFWNEFHFSPCFQVDTVCWAQVSGFPHCLCYIYKLTVGDASRRYIVLLRRLEPRCQVSFGQQKPLTNCWAPPTCPTIPSVAFMGQFLLDMALHRVAGVGACRPPHPHPWDRLQDVCVIPHHCQDTLGTFFSSCTNRCN